MGDIIYMVRQGYDWGASMRAQSLGQNYGINDDGALFTPTRLFKEITSQHCSVVGRAPGPRIQERDRMSRESYMQLLRATDGCIADLLDRGFVFVTNAFRPAQAPAGIPDRDCDEMAARLRGEGWEVEVAAAYDERGRTLPGMASLWRRRPV